MRLRTQNWFVFILLLSLTQGAMSEQAPAKSADHGCCAPLVRKAHLFHPLIWSGIFPFYGGFIPDPHCLFSKEMALPPSALDVLGRPSGTFQVLDVNPYFNNKSSEIVLLIRSGKEVFEYSLEIPRHRGIQAVSVEPGEPAVRIFSYKGRLAALANFSKVSGVYLIELPLHSKAPLTLNRVGSPVFEDVARAFASAAEDATVKAEFCETTNDFGNFYERYAGRCDTHPHRTYEDFWSSY